MGKYLKYIKYVIRHKWFVFVECCKYGLVFEGLFHDISKFLPSEFFPYANFFYGKNSKKPRDKTGYYKPTDTGDIKFDYAWLYHQKRNKHHWQYWILPEDEGGIKLMPMPDKYIIEMVCDWRGAGKAQGFTGKDEIAKWYLANKEKMQLNPETREKVENLLSLMSGVSVKQDYQEDTVEN